MQSLFTTYRADSIRECFIHELRWDTKEGITCFFSLFVAQRLNISFLLWAGMAGELYIFRHVTPEVCCSQDPMTL